MFTESFLVHSAHKKSYSLDLIHSRAHSSVSK